MFDNRCPVCNNELIDTAYGRLCFYPGCDVFDEYMLFEEKEGAQRWGNNLIFTPKQANSPIVSAEEH